MAKNYAKYINGNLRKLADYINHIVDFNNKYGKAVKDLCSQSQNGKVTKSKELIEYEKEMKQSYDKAIKLYNDLTQIAERYKAGRNIDSDIKWFHSNFNLAGLTTYKKITLKLEPSKQEGIVTGGASIIDLGKQYSAEIAIGNNYNIDLYDYAQHKYGPDTAGMLDLAHEKQINPNYTKDAIKLTNWNDSKVASDKEYLRDKVIKGFSYYDYDEDNVPGYFFKNYSEPSQRISNNKDFLEKIKEKNKVLNNKEELSVGFTDKNLHNAIGKADIRQRYLDKNGNLHVKIYDTYDFNPKDDNPFVIAGKKKMLDGELKPFFTIHDIIIPKETLKELWK